MKRSVFVAAVAATLLAVTPLANAAIINWYADLNGPNEAPPNASPGSGFASVSVDTVAHTLHVQASFSDLLGTTTAAHIHCCTAVPLTGTVGVATMVPNFAGFPLGVTSGAYDASFDLTMASSFNANFINNNGGTPASAEQALIAGMSAGRSYFNVHSTSFPGGEIRGFLVPVPEPTMLSLLALGLGAGIVARRRQRST